MLSIIRRGLIILAILGLAMPAWAQDTASQSGVIDNEGLLAPLEPVDVFHGAGILLLQTPDGQFKWWLDGRIMLDTAAYMNSDNTLANGVEARRVRMAMNLMLWKTWAAQMDVDFAGNEVDIKDLWIGYTGVPNSILRMGHFKEPFGLETITSSRYITFTERALIDNFSPDRRVGVTYSAWRNRWQASGGVFGPALEDTVDTIGQDQGYGFTGRFTTLPVHRGNNLIHVGLAANYSTPKAATDPTLKDAHQMRLRARPESHVNRGRFIDTGKISNVDHQELWGVEVAGVFGPLSVQSEYNTMTFKRTVSTLVAPQFDGWYAFVSWFPTGEHRPYDHAAGEFGRVLPRSHRGALELVSRYSTADLNDPAASIFGGREKITTIGANWYINGNIRVMTNYLFVNNDQYAKGDRNYIVGDKFNVLQARLQLNF